MTEGVTAAWVAQQAGKGRAPAKKRAPKTRKEQDIQRAILDYLKLVPGVTVWKSGGGLLPLADGRRVRMGAVGVSDLVGWVQEKYVNLHAHGYVARFLAIEVKRSGAFTTAKQRAFLDAVTAAGGVAFVARSVEDVRRGLASRIA